MNKLILIIVIILLSNLITAQEVSYTTLGSDELSNHEIYDLLQAENKHLYIATNKGVIKYNGYKFEQLKQSSDISTHSFFDLKIDQLGSIYCSSLNGKILKIKEDSLVVFYRDSVSRTSARLYYNFLPDNSLLVLSSKLLHVKPQEVSVLYEPPHTMPIVSGLHKISSKHFVFYHTVDSMYRSISIFEKGNVSISEYPILSDTLKVAVLSIKDTSIYYDANSGKLIRYGAKTSYLHDSAQVNNKKFVTYISLLNKICVLNNSNGVRFFNDNMIPLYQGKTFLKNHFISCVTQDREGNHLFGTFNSGIIVVPNLNVCNYSQEKLKLSQVECIQNELYATNTGNELIYLDEYFDQTVLHTEADKIVNLLALPKIGKLIGDSKEDFIYDVKNGKSTPIEISSIKDVVTLGYDSILIGTNKGLFSSKISTPLNLKELIDGRCYKLGFETESKSIYAHHMGGLLIGNVNQLNYDHSIGDNVIINTLESNDNQTLVAVDSKGVYEFSNKELIKTHIQIDNYDLKHTRIMKYFNDYIYFLTDKHLLKLDHELHLVGVLSESDGLEISGIKDLAIVKNQLIALNSKNVQTIHTDSIHMDHYSPTLSINQIMVNGQTVGQAKNTFDHTHTKFEFILSSPSIIHSNEVKYVYKLEGIDSEYQVNDYSNNLLVYKSLPPGEYTLSVMVEYHNKRTEPISYTFTILRPFWQTWPFYLGSLLLTVLLVYLITQKRIKAIRKKSELRNELNLSKLIAIQSQMNPHFIFNAINSIQDLILEEKTEEAYHYVVKFSQLVRKTLTFSNREFINFEDELSLLTIYLEIEKLRFKDDFTFNIYTNGISEILLPPMLIQPFVENVIKHGLIHKTGQKKISISFRLETQLLICQVSDNGIGRTASSKIKERRNDTHESFATGANAKRLSIMNEHYNQKVSFFYEDLQDDEKVLGTKLTIIMPYREY